MRTCENCGAQFPDDELICPVCGHEVQLVPDYVTIESKMQEDRKRKEDEERQQREEQERLRALEKRKREIHKRILLLSLLIAAAAAVIIISVAAWHFNRQSHSFSYQYEQAENAYEIGDYEDALSYITNALRIDASNTDGLYLEAEIYAAMGKNSDAEKVLISLINKDYSYSKAYDLLISLYTKDGNTDAIRNLLKDCKNKSVLAKYKDYLPEEPVISPDGGTYSSIQTVTITSSSKGTIYYTTDDSDPDSSSTKYTGSFDLPEGTTTVKAIVITDKGISSSIASQEFNIELDTPAAPKITPESGTYTHIQDDGDTSGTLNSESVSSSSTEENTDITQITVTVPDGYTCYYAFDQQPTKSSSKYKKPVSMRKGEHVFYAVLCSKEGKLGKVASATYIYNVVTPTATVTPTPTRVPTQSASETYTPANTYNSETIATPTPTATPTAEPTQKPTATPAASSSSSQSGNKNNSTEESDKSNEDTSSGKTSE